MNLFDIVKRSDRCLEVVSGKVEAVRFERPLLYYAIVLTPGTRVRLKSAHDFAALSTFPRDLGWTAISRGALPPAVEVIVRLPDGSNSATIAKSDGKGELTLTWPFWPALVGAFDIEIVNSGQDTVEIKSGAVFDPRAALRSLLQGTGVEVGPGANPFVKPSGTVDVRYVEALPIEEWLRNYGKHLQPTDEFKAMWSRYILGDAQQIECCEAGTLDFIFSNHVFEHLGNPLGVLENWSAKLKPGGAVVCVVPDLRYCFDLRQPESTQADWLHEYENQIWDLKRHKYEKWCRYTAPYNDIEDLISRNYSIHAHYYSTSSFRKLADIAIGKGFFDRVFLNTSPNNKDFGWALWKAPA